MYASSGEDDTNDTDNNDNDDTGYDFDNIISLDSANIIVNEDNEISLPTANRTDLPNNWVENVDTTNLPRITLLILKQDNNASISDDK